MSNNPALNSVLNTNRVALMRSHISVSVLLVLAGSSILGQSPKTPVDTYGDAAAIAIYRGLLPTPINGKSILLVSTTRPPNAICGDISVDRREPSEYRDAVADFKRANLRSRDLRSLLGAENVNFIAERELHSLFDSGNVPSGWREFYRTHPNAGGIFAFSAIGFNKTRTLAVVYSEGGCGALCGSGRFRFLKLGVTGWNEVKPPVETCNWIS